MPKPILLVRMPKRCSMVELANADKILEQKGIGIDYHFLVITSQKDDIEIEVVNASDLDPVEFETFKQSIKDELENRKQ